MKHHSPSHLCNLSLCPRCTPSESTNDAAEYGTVFHDNMQRLIASTKPSGFEDAIASLDASDAMKEDIREALRQADAYLSLGLPVHENKAFRFDDELETIPEGVYLECSIELWPDDRRHKVGRIDMLVVPSKSTAIVVDWKTNRVDADFTWQLDSYVGALYRLVKNPWKQVMAKIIAPNLEEHEDIVYDERTAKMREAEILRVEERANNPFSPPSPGPVQCKYCYCAEKMLCPAYREFMASQFPDREFPAVHIAEAQPVLRSVPILKSPRTLGERAARRDWATVAEAIIGFVKEDDKKFFAKPENADAALPGYKVAHCSGKSSIDKDRLKELNEHLMETFGLSYAQMEASSEPVKAKVVELLALKLGTKKAAELAWARETEKFSKRGAGYCTISREVSRRLPQIPENE